MKPEDIAKAGTEHAHQAALFCWAYKKAVTSWPQLKWLYAIPNGGERNPATAARLKAEGVKSGVSDVCLPSAQRGYHGLYIEMKKPGSEGKAAGKESPAQVEFGKFLADEHYMYRCCHDWMTAAQTIAWYMGVDDGTY
jgi:hypothetical protein